MSMFDHILQNSFLKIIFKLKDIFFFIKKISLRKHDQIDFYSPFHIVFENCFQVITIK